MMYLKRDRRAAMRRLVFAVVMAFTTASLTLWGMLQGLSQVAPTLLFILLTSTFVLVIRAEVSAIEYLDGLISRLEARAEREAADQAARDADFARRQEWGRQRGLVR